MHVLTNPNELEPLFLQESALRELRQQLFIPGHNPKELCALWQDLPASLIYFNEGDLPEVLLMGLLAQLPPPEFEVPINESLRLRLHVLNDYGAGIYFLYHINPN
ncbi:MAG: hypothetical protein KJ900_08660 [Proteobacteria bacterium]|jgi:hypothetical protein|nr:hypothetical protein [Desulfocapsa sp.]MBU3945566.1 hypothetical protein [Pseudomonadota bacterium]MCG2742983.1 hypothetical protein [Desulfobacteraceae bacterium]MBU3982797.1 hypothetical protein [Pseudomonadota bacterium]MBU4030417.1 hypothetical protein [Pseudomonadota bacterium]